MSLTPIAALLLLAAQPADGAAADTPAASEAAGVSRDHAAPGTAVRHTSGAEVGRIESADEEGAVVASGDLRVRLPYASFARGENGLLISLTAEELRAEVARARAEAEASPQSGAE
jgi:Arc/MetJ family transcription regulator